ncbi:MAG: hypothetical protein AB4206_10270 [Xenococcaceae cyanobacterium]
MRQFLLSRIKNPADVDDLLQEILIKTYRNLDTVKSRVQRGRSMLKAKFEECCSYELDVRGNIIDFTSRSG